ncbi:1724_t:CDS:2, partial [Cetraspora pellucida]
EEMTELSAAEKKELGNPSETQLRKLGKIRSEGAQYIVKEGDICHFLF